jgi:short subunit dehydrogenase-like uncharacterized protein
MTASSEPAWMIYGANGYTGRLIAELAKASGLSPILAGRDAAKIRPIAEALGLSWKAFGLQSAEEALPAVREVRLVLHCAGPFSTTSAPMVDACLRAQAHYLDITGEIDVFEAIFARDEAAKRSGSVLMPGVGCDVVPSDCLAAQLHARLPDAMELDLAMASFGDPSPGTLKTMVEGMAQPGKVRRGGKIISVPPRWKVKEVPFSDKPRLCTSIPWGDVSTAYHSTGIADITFYMQLPRAMIGAMRFAGPFMPLMSLPAVQRLLKAQIDRRVRGPSADKRAAGRVQFWGEVRNLAGKTVAGTLEAPDGYSLTAAAAVESARRVLSGSVPPGAFTPSRALGADFIETLPHTRLSIQTGS